MSAHTEAHLPAYAERDLAASLEKLGISPDSEAGQEARENAAQRHRNKLLAARLRRANKKTATKAAEIALAEPEELDDEKKDDGADSSASVTLSPTKKPRRVRASAKSLEAPEDSSEPTSELETPKASRKRGARKEKGSLPDTGLSTR